MSEFEYKAFEAKFGGLPPEDFKRFLANKLKVLFVVKNGTLGTIMKKATESSVRKVCIRPKISDPYELDRRCSRSIAWYNIIIIRPYGVQEDQRTFSDHNVSSKIRSRNFWEKRNAKTL